VIEIDAGRLVLRPIGRDVALGLLEGRVPEGIVLGPGYPSQFSLEVMELVARAPAEEGGGFGPYFMVRKADGAVVGEIGAGLDRASATAQVGYTVVEPCWGQGYATEALRALLAHALAGTGVRRVVAETLVGHVASRRVMEKAGMRHSGQREGEVDGGTVELVVYEALAGGIDAVTGPTVRRGGGQVREPLGIAVAQPLCVPYDVATNAVTHAATVRSAGARVVVFPELSLTGYELDAPAITVQDPRLTPIVQACAEAGSLALVGAPVHGEAGRSHIAMVAVEGTGATVAYHKMWLSTTESNRFTPGSRPAVLDVDGWRLGLAVCKDTGIPRHASDTAALGIDVYVAATLKSAEEAALQDERARRVATDHQVWVAVASFAGTTGGGYAQAAGRSSIWTSDGVAIARAGAGAGAFARATLRADAAAERGAGQ
jgi:predicted amidohydrolase/RimJ/RimL family protein N-acetyltransferase